MMQLPNECVICYVTDKLKRCARCQMISYCGSDHQKEHWPVHKEICKAISAVAKEKGISHLFEKLRGLDAYNWVRKRQLLNKEVAKKLGRDINLTEVGLLKLPRACFVCHDVRQDLLKNCPGCSFASFCKEHPSSPIHDKECSTIKQFHGYEIEFQKSTKIAPMKIHLRLEELRKSILDATQIKKTSKLPSSMLEYMDMYGNTLNDVPENLMWKIFISEDFSLPLTLFNTLNQFKCLPASEIVIHMVCSKPVKDDLLWELLLHLLPDLNVLKIVQVVGEDIANTQVRLCKKCRSSKKQIFVHCTDYSYLEYTEQKSFQKPDIIAFLIAFVIKEHAPLLGWRNKLIKCRELNVPMLFMNHAENGLRYLKESVIAPVGGFEICFDGRNDFASLWYTLDAEGILCSANLFIITMKPGDGPCKLEWTPSISCRKFFYSNYCPVCCSTETPVVCNRCKMIFYCSDYHQAKHQGKHKDICKVILAMLNESKESNLFNKFKKTDSESWFLAKIDLVKKAETKIGREIRDYEKQMFLFPKTCFVCHESDLSVLKHCECGVCLCKVHKNNSKHKKLCQNFSLVCKLSMLDRIFVQLTFDFNIEEDLPTSMKVFLDKFKDNDECMKVDIPDFQKIQFSKLCTRPLTLVSAIRKLGLDKNVSLVVHVIGAAGTEIGFSEYWCSLISWLYDLMYLKIVFIGPDVLKVGYDLQEDFNKTENQNLILEVAFYVMQYEEYLKSESFEHPDLVVGYNLNLHESELGISKKIWKDTVLSLKKVNVPFVLTAGTEDRALRDHEALCKLLETSVDYFCLERNPFATLYPERDFESEELLYENQYLIIYQQLEKDSTETAFPETEELPEEDSEKLKELGAE